MLSTVGAVMFLGGLWLFFSALSDRKAVRKHEFENRSSGGAVGFDSFEASERHRKRANGAELKGRMGVGLILVGPIFYFAGGAF
ncbi:hypothetical protein [Sphingomonas sp.]|uniref:hypothetical protein n=1 Tax=Sphingomonas sp. TaxID=28214 RepID=UPI002DD61A96|nr:hypothetical protein [Sphingomonas sp.]